jgi:hypothetical protein
VTSVKVRVLTGWAVHDGTAQRGAGELVETDADTAKAWLASGWVEPAPASTSRKR